MIQVFLPLALVLAGGGSALSVWLKARASRRAGVREADVADRKNSGDLALELIRDLRSTVARVEGDRDEDRARISQLERVNLELSRDVEIFRSAVVDATHALDDMVEWEKNGAQPPAPHRLSAITWRLKRAITKENP